MDSDCSQSVGLEKVKSNCYRQKLFSSGLCTQYEDGATQSDRLLSSTDNLQTYHTVAGAEQSLTVDPFAAQDYCRRSLPSEIRSQSSR